MSFLPGDEKKSESASCGGMDSVIFFQSGSSSSIDHGVK